MEENKKAIKFYRCEYCGHIHHSPADRARCELKCEEEAKKKEAFEKARMLRETKQRRYEDIENLIVEFNKDYKTSFGIASQCYNPMKINIDGELVLADVLEKLIRY